VLEHMIIKHLTTAIET